MDRCLFEGLARFQNRIGERRLIGGIRIVLRLETEGIVLVVAAARFRAVQEVPRVELDSRLSGQDFHHATGGGILHACRELECAIL